MMWRSRCTQRSSILLCSKKPARPLQQLIMRMSFTAKKRVYTPVVQYLAAPAKTPRNTVQSLYCDGQ